MGAGIAEVLPVGYAGNGNSLGVLENEEADGEVGEDGIN